MHWGRTVGGFFASEYTVSWSGSCSILMYFILVPTWNIVCPDPPLTQSDAFASPRTSFFAHDSTISSFSCFSELYVNLGFSIICFMKTFCERKLILFFFHLQNDGGARRSALLKDDKVISHFYDDVKTLYEAFQRGLRVSGIKILHNHCTGICHHFFLFHYLTELHISLLPGNGPCLGYRKPNQPYQWLSYKQVRGVELMRKCRK